MWLMWASKDRYSSSSTPRSLKDFVAPLFEIRSMLKILVGSLRAPISLLLNTTFKLVSSIGFPWVLKIMYFVLEVLTAILFDKNQFATF